MRGQSIGDPRHVNVQELFDEIAGSTYFTQDQLLRQFVNSEDSGEDFDIIHGSTLYRVPLANIREFFAVHKRPEIQMTTDQENIYLKKRLTEMENQVAELGGEAGDSKKKFRAKTHRDSIVEPKPSKKAPRAEVPQEEQAAQSLTSIQEELREQVKDKQPVTVKNQGKTGSRKPAGKQPSAL